MSEKPEGPIDDPALEDDDAADAPSRAEADDEAELGCTVEGGLVCL